jgi:serine phosphatase RsbU (regulator of sigma subunit)
VGQVLRDGRATLVAEIDDGFLDRVTRNPEHRRAVVALGMRSLIIVPLIARGRTLGAITLVIDSSDRRYDDQDLATARGLADRAALAIDNARLYQAQIEIATTLQRSLLPFELPSIDGVELACRYIAAGEAIEVGGDFYDVWHLGVDGFGVAIGDVSGKGPTAASMTALARHTVRVASLHEPTPSRVLRVLNDEICRHIAADMFCTAAYVHATAGGERGGLDVTISRGGHPSALLRRPDGSVEEFGRPGTLLGVRGEVELVDDRVHLPVGATVVLYTDGVTERRNGRELFGDRRLVELVAGLPTDAGAEQIVEAVEQAVAGFAPEPPQDDVAIVAFRAV